MKRPSNLHGYSSSSPFLLPTVFAGAGIVKEGSVGHLNAWSDVVDEAADAGWNAVATVDDKKLLCGA